MHHEARCVPLGYRCICKLRSLEEREPVCVFCVHLHVRASVCVYAVYPTTVCGLRVCLSTAATR
jgi:hypothetical protein